MSIAKVVAGCKCEQETLRKKLAEWRKSKLLATMLCNCDMTVCVAWYVLTSN